MSTAGNSNFPWLVNMQSQLLVNNIDQKISLINVIPTTTGAKFTASLLNTNGFIVLAAMKGLFYPNMSLPSTFNIKNG